MSSEDFILYIKEENRNMVAKMEERGMVHGHLIHLIVSVAERELNIESHRAPTAPKYSLKNQFENKHKPQHFLVHDHHDAQIQFILEPLEPHVNGQFALVAFR